MTIDENTPDSLSASSGQQDSPDQPKEASSAPKQRGRKTFVLLFEVVLLAILGCVLYAKLTPSGQVLWQTIVSGRSAEAEQLAIEKLSGYGVLVITEPPDRHATSVNFTYGGNKYDADAFRQIHSLGWLSALDFTDCNITDDELACVDGLTDLGSLTLANTAITDAGLKHLRSLPSITAIYLPGTRLSDAGLQNLAGLRTIQILDLSSTKVTDAGLKHLTGLDRLQWLLLNDVPVADAGVDALAAMKGLRRVSIKGTQLTPAGIDRLKAAKPGLNIDQ